MSLWSKVVCWLPVAGIVLSTALATEWEHPEVASRAAILESPASTPEERSAALNELRDTAKGQPLEQKTRESILALAQFLDRENQTQPNEALNMMQAAVTYYPDDPRSTDVLPRLGLFQIESGEAVSAHVSLMHLFQRQDASTDPVLLARAAANALVVGDLASALNWSYRADLEQLPVEFHVSLWRTRLVSAQELGRHKEALEAIGELDRIAPETVRQNPDAMLAAARTDAAVGRKESAAARYDAFVNIHARHPQRAKALLEYGKILAGLHQTDRAILRFDWILEAYPHSQEADIARLERVEADPATAPADRVQAYRRVAQEVYTEAVASEACKRILETLLGIGQPVEAISLLSWMAKNGTGPSTVAARIQFSLGLDPIMTFLAEAQDDVGLAAAAAEAEALDISLPSSLEELARAAQRRLGLPSAAESVLDTAQVHARAGRWDEVRATLAAGLSDTKELPHPLRTARARLSAQASWNEGQDEFAVELINTALTSDLGDPERRSLLVLRADIRFAAGDTSGACPDYIAAAQVGASQWVSRQLASCERPLPPSEEPIR